MPSCAKFSRLWLLVLLPATLLAVDGAPDPDFQGPGGYVAYSAGVPSHLAGRGTIAPDGAAIFVSHRTSTSSIFLVSRVTATDGPQSYQLSAAGATDVHPSQAVFDSAGRLLIVGTATYYRPGLVVMVARILYPDMALDTAFDGDGYVTFDLPEDLSGVAIAPVIVPLGPLRVERLVVAGTLLAPPGSPGDDIVVLRLTEAGSLDSGFGGGDGWVRHDFDLQDQRALPTCRSTPWIASSWAAPSTGPGIPTAWSRDSCRTALSTPPSATSGWTRIEPDVDPVDERLFALTLGERRFDLDRGHQSERPARQSSSSCITSIPPAAGRLCARRVHAAGAVRVAGVERQGDGRLIVFGDTDRHDGDRDLFVTACRPTSFFPCSWEAGFGPLDATT